MAKIITVTANTAIDLFLEVEGLGERDNLMASHSAEFVCGKGINAARTVASLLRPVLCLGFAGKQSMPLFEAVASRGLRTDLIAVEGKTRTNLTLLDTQARRETHIRTPGFTVTAEDCRKLAEKLDACAAAGDIVIFSGSLPPGAPRDLYRSLMDRCRRRQATVFLDTSGPGLREGLKAEPYLIKPNRQELEEIAGEPLPDDRALVGAARALVDQGVQWVYVSCGEQGLVVVGRETALKASVKGGFGRVVSTVGCGDAMVGGLAAALFDGLDSAETIRIGVACGMANLYSREPGAIDRVRMAEIMNHVETSPL